MNGRESWAVTAVVAASLLSLYGALIYWLGQNPIFLPASALEEAILGTMLLRLVLILSVRRLRRSAVAAADIFTAEILIVPALILAGITAGNPREYLSFAGDVLLVWAAAVLLVFPAFAIYRVAEMLRSGARLTSLILSSTGIYVVLLLMLSATEGTTSAVGLAGLTRLLIGAILNGTTVASAQPVATAAGVALYVGLVAHSALGAGQPSRRVEPLLLFPVLGTAAALAWGFLAGMGTNDTLFIFGVPSLLVIAAMWLVSRAG